MEWKTKQNCLLLTMYKDDKPKTKEIVSVFNNILIN